MKNVPLHNSVNEKLDEISKKRKESGALTRTKKDIVAELIAAAHKREVG